MQNIQGPTDPFIQASAESWLALLIFGLDLLTIGLALLTIDLASFGQKRSGCRYTTSNKVFYRRFIRKVTYH
jgi:hypothetical protein